MSDSSGSQMIRIDGSIPISPHSDDWDYPGLEIGCLRVNTDNSDLLGEAGTESPSEQSISYLSLNTITNFDSVNSRRLRSTIFNNHSTVLRSSSAPSMNQLPAQTASDEQVPATATPASGVTRHSASTVKHLTCFWWKEKGTCRFSDEDCLYAHHDTGHYTDAPRQLLPGEPALAGRRLDRAMRNLALAAQRSSASIHSAPASRHASRPNTPLVGAEQMASNLNFSSPLTPPMANIIAAHLGNDTDLARLNSDNSFLRNLVEQSGKEKAILISTIEALRTDNKGMKGEVEGLRKAQEQLLVEREGLHNRIKQLEEEKSLGTRRSVSSHPYGTIGRGRVNTEARYIGGLLEED